MNRLRREQRGGRCVIWFYAASVKSFRPPFKKGGRKKRQGPLWVLPFFEGSALPPGRSLHKNAARRPQESCWGAPPAPSKIRDKRHAAGRGFCRLLLPAFLKNPGKKLWSAAPRTVGRPIRFYRPRRRPRSAHPPHIVPFNEQLVARIIPLSVSRAAFVAVHLLLWR